MDLRGRIRDIPDFPKPGILFRDITTLLQDAEAYGAALAGLEDLVRGERIAKVAGIESRGFILGAALADRLRSGFVPVRKRGKLPGATVRVAYELEYGSDIIEIHEDAVSTGDPVLLVDDLIATGGTAEAAIKLLRKINADVVGAAFAIDLLDLGGSARLARHGIECHTLMTFEGN